MILLISNSRDFATDFVVAVLLERGVPYLRFDLDLASQDQISLDPVRQILSLESGQRASTVSTNDVTSILYRAPTHLRESSAGRGQPEELLARHQWTAFARSLMIFENALWINHPCATYRAENKAFQLLAAAQVGFAIPRTLVTNAAARSNEVLEYGRGSIAVKALDSFLLRVNQNEDAFFYTQAVAQSELCDSDLRAMPAILQEFLEPKLDIRVTVVGQRCFAASVLKDGKEIIGDWRILKDQVRFAAFPLPEAISSKCVALVHKLGLAFGAIDLAKKGDDFYFFEVNPTGEWGWLVTECGMPIDQAIADELAK
jgi:glutathione synthase/RimK-type ligase-like ATP-grasp enzyme